jgi:hypothetical protein
MFACTLYPDLRGKPRPPAPICSGKAIDNPLNVQTCQRLDVATFFFAIPFIIRRSELPFPQTLYNPYLRDPLGSEGNKRLTTTNSRSQLLYNQYLQSPLRSAGNKGLITPVESALTKNAPVTPLESALPKREGGGSFRQFATEPFHRIVEPDTCSEGVHRTYYWSRRLSPTNCLRVTVLAFHLRGRV